MDQAEDSSLSEHRNRVVLSDNEADEAAIEVAGLSRRPKFLSDNSSVTDQIKLCKRSSI